MHEFAELVRDLGGGGGGAVAAPSGPYAARPASSVVAAFEYFDRNRSGYLDYRELRNALTYMGLDVSTAATVDLLRAYDDYPDGKLDVHEFETLVRDLKSASAAPAVAGVGYLDAQEWDTRRGCRGRRQYEPAHASRPRSAPARRIPEGRSTTRADANVRSAASSRSTTRRSPRAGRSTTLRRSTSCGRWEVSGRRCQA